MFLCMREKERKLGPGKVLIPEITRKVFYIRLIQQGTLKMTSVSPMHSRFTVRLQYMCGQEVSVFVMLQRHKHLIDCLIQILFPTRVTVSAPRHFIDKLTMSLQLLYAKNIVGTFILVQKTKLSDTPLHPYRKIYCRIL